MDSYFNFFAFLDPVSICIRMQHEFFLAVSDGEVELHSVVPL
jgi:hypothetical protein